MYRRKRARFLRAPLRAFPSQPHRARGAPGRAAHILVRRSTPRFRFCRIAPPPLTVIPAKAGIHLDLALASARRKRALLGPLCRGAAAEESPKGRAQDAREFLVGTWTCRRETPEPTRAPGAQGCAEGAAPGCPFFGPPFFWTSTAPQERRERRRRPEGRRAGCPESRKVGRRPLRATKPATAPLKASVSARCGEARQRQQRDQGGFQLSLE
jgi:hypothetical protein